MSVTLQFQQQINMPIQISPEVFKWLQSLSLVKQAKRNQNNMMEMSGQNQSRFLDGPALGVLLKSMLKGKSDEEKVKKLQALKENSTPAIRLYNWGILTEVLKQMGYMLDYANKSKLTSLQPEPLINIFNFLMQLRAKDPTLKIQGTSNLKLQIGEIAKKTPKDSSNTLEFLTILISKHFKISPQQTLNLFLDNNKYLSHLLAKGVKNSFEPVYSLLNQIKTHAEFIVTRLLCIDEDENANFLFTALRSCLISKDQQTAKLFCEISIQIYHQFRLSSFSPECIRKWIRNEGINTLFFSIKKHPTMIGSIIQVCYSYLDDQFFKHLQLSQKSILWSTDRQKFVFYKDFCHESTEQIFNKFAITSYFDQWNKMFVKTMKKTKESYEILLIISIMETQWNTLGTKFQQHDLGLGNMFINFLKTVTSIDNELLFIQSCRTLFSLMQTLGKVKNPFAPLIYKILISLFGSINDKSRILFLCQNFTVSFKGISSLPGSLLVQPLLKHLESSLQHSMLQLVQWLAEQKRIGDNEVMDLIQMLSKVVFQDVRFGNLALDTIFNSLPNVSSLTSRSFLENNMKLCLSQLYSLSKSITKSVKALKDELARLQSAEGKAAENFTSITTKHILSKNIVKYIGKTIFLDDTIKKKSQILIFHTYIKIKVQLKKIQQAELLRPIMTSYYQDEQLQQKITFYTNQLYPPKPKVQREKSHGHEHDHDHISVSKSVTLRPATSRQQEKQPVVLDPSVLKPSSFAIKDLEKAKQKRYDLKTLEQQKQKQKQLKAQKIQKFKTIQHEKRMIQSMTAIKNDVEYNHFQTLDMKNISETIDLNTTTNLKQKQVNVPHIRLVNLQKEEEDTYREDTQSIMRRYRKVWRYLFYKYSSKKVQTGAQQKAHMGEAWKMLKDYEFNFLKKEECFTIVRLVNESFRRKNDIQYLTYNGFEQFILQAAIIGYSRNGYAHVPPGQQLLLLIQQLKKITKEKSGSVQIFENPQQAYFQESQVIREFNKRLKVNPEYILPEGYKKVKQVTLQYQYDFHPLLQKNIKSSYIDVLEILDQLFFKNAAFTFHVIEPLTIKSELYLAKPNLFQSINHKMKDYSKGYLNPKRSISASDVDGEKNLISLPSPPAKKQFKPYINFSLGIKLGIAETNIKSRSIAEQVAYCMQDILNAIENQSTVVKKGKRKLTNQFMRKKRLQIVKIESQKKKQQVNWKKRAQSVKLQVEALKQKRKENEKQKKKKQYLEKKAKKERQEKIYKQKLSEFQKVKAKIAQKKEALLQLKAIEQQKIKKQKQQYKQGVEEYFKKKKNELKQKQQEYKRKKNEQKQKKQQTQQKSKQFVKRLYLNNLKKQEDVLEKIDEIKETYEQAWKSQQIQNLLSQKRLSLKYLFDLLLKYEKSKISATNYDQISVNTLNYFCLKFKIVPFMLQKQDVNKIYTYIMKQQEDKKRKGISVQKFQEALFLIAVKAKKLLNKINQKRKKKQKKLQAFLNAKKSAGGNHFQTKQVDDSQSSSEQSQDEEKPTLQDDYLFDASDVTEQTLTEIFNFLKLPSDKAGMQQRYKQISQSKTSKPKNILIKEIKQALDQS